MTSFTWQRFDFDELNSTNNKAAELAVKLQKPLFVVAKRQTNGRGRRGRSWESLTGNLFVSFAFDGAGLSAGQWSVLSGVAVMQTVRHFCPEADVKIKWPNDVLAFEGKISGILFERADNGFWVMGVGINVACHPQETTIGYHAESLAHLGAQADSNEVLNVLIQKFTTLSAQALTESFEPVRQVWLDNAYHLGQNIKIKQEKQIVEGVLEGLDSDANLLIRTDKGLNRLNYGDILYEKE